MKTRKSKMIFFKDSKIVLVEKKYIFFEPAHFCASLQIYFKKKLKSMDFHYAKKIPGLISETGGRVANCAWSIYYTKPCATIALATLTNPAMFAPAT